MLSSFIQHLLECFLKNKKEDIAFYSAPNANSVINVPLVTDSNSRMEYVCAKSGVVTLRADGQTTIGVIEIQWTKANGEGVQGVLYTSPLQNSTNGAGIALNVSKGQKIRVIARNCGTGYLRLIPYNGCT